MLVWIIGLVAVIVAYYAYILVTAEQDPYVGGPDADPESSEASSRPNEGNLCLQQSQTGLRT